MEMKLQKNQRIILVSIAVLICLCNLWRYAVNDDAPTHIARLVYLAQNIKELGIIGTYQSKVYFGMIQGQGYAYPTFYGDILYYPEALILGCIGINNTNAELLYRIMILAAYTFGFCQVCLIQNKILKDSGYKDLQLLIGVLWIQQPYNLNGLSQNQVAIFAYQLIPIILYSYYMVYKSIKDGKQKSVYIYILQLQMWAIINIHLVQFIFVLSIIITTFLYKTAILLKDNKAENKKIIKSCILAYTKQSILCIFGSLYLIVPMIEHLKTGIYTVSNVTNNMQSSQNTSLIGQVAPQYVLNVIESIINPQSQTVYTYISCGYQLFYLIIIVVTGVILVRYGKKTLGFVNMTYQLGYIILMYQPINLQIIEIIQFRMRLNIVLDIVTIQIILISIVELHKLLRKSQINKLINAVITISLIQTVLNVQYAQLIEQRQYDTQIQVGGGGEYLIYNQEYDKQAGGLLLDAVMPYDTQQHITDMLGYSKQFKDTQIISRDGNIYKIEADLSKLDKLQDSYNSLVKDSETQYNYFHIPVTYDIWYRVYINGKVVESQPDKLGFIQVIQNELEEYTSLEIVYDTPNYVKALQIIQIATIFVNTLIIAVYIIRDTQKIKSRKHLKNTLSKNP